jgi:type II secretory pathway component GspD/PulD (secretin)
MLHLRRYLGLGVWLGLIAVFGVGAAGAQQGGEAGKEGSTPAKFTFFFKSARWSDVLEWLSDITGKGVVTPYPRLGTFTFIPPKLAPDSREFKKYTVAEIIDVLNEALLAQKHMIVRRPQTLGVYPIDEPLDPSLFRTVSLQELTSPELAKTEMVRFVYSLKWLIAEDFAGSVKKMMGPFGQVMPIEEANKLILIDSVVNLRTVVQTIKEIEDQPQPRQWSWSHKCKYCKATLAAEKIRDILGDPQKLYLLQNRRSKGDGQGPPLLPAHNVKYHPYVVTAVEVTNTVIVSGPPNKIALARSVIEQIDVPQRANQPPITLKRYKVPLGNAEAVVKVLQMIRTPPWIRITAVRKSLIMVYATAEEQMVIAVLLQGHR